MRQLFAAILVASPSFTAMVFQAGGTWSTMAVKDGEATKSHQKTANAASENSTELARNALQLTPSQPPWQILRRGQLHVLPHRSNGQLQVPQTQPTLFVKAIRPVVGSSGYEKTDHSFMCGQLVCHAIHPQEIPILQRTFKKPLVHRD